jgi:glycosyltransferase involved in cell wall biosynthesis
LSIVVPCFNELDRLPKMMKETMDVCYFPTQCLSQFLDHKVANDGKKVEIILVDACSKDNTLLLIKEFTRDDSRPLISIRGISMS